MRACLFIFAGDTADEKVSPSVESQWLDIGYGIDTPEAQTLMLGGEIAMWTLEYREGACVAADKHGCGVTQFAPAADPIFSRSFGGNEGDGTLAGEGRGGAKPLRGESARPRALYSAHGALRPGPQGVLCPGGLMLPKNAPADRHVFDQPQASLQSRTPCGVSTAV